MSPEVLRGDGYDFKSDIWSLGCLLYELTMLKSPFKAEGLNLYSLFQKISQGDYQPLPETYSLELRTLAYKMISTKSEDRPEIADVCVRAAALRQLTAAGRKASAESVISVGVDDKNAKDLKDVKDKAKAKVVEEKEGQSDSVSEGDRTGRRGEISRMSSGTERKEQIEKHRSEEQDNRVESKIDNGREREGGREAKRESREESESTQRGGIAAAGGGGGGDGRGEGRDLRASGKASEKSNGSSSVSGDNRNQVSRSRSEDSENNRLSDLQPNPKVKGTGAGVGVGTGGGIGSGAGVGIGGGIGIGAGNGVPSSRLQSPDAHGNSERDREREKERGKYLPPSNIATIKIGRAHV